MVTYRDQLMSTPSRLPFIAESNWHRHLAKRLLGRLMGAPKTRKGRQAHRNMAEAVDDLPTVMLEYAAFNGAPR